MPFQALFDSIEHRRVAIETGESNIAGHAYPALIKQFADQRGRARIIEPSLVVQQARIAACSRRKPSLIDALCVARNLANINAPVGQALPAIPRKPNEVGDARRVPLQFLAQAAIPEQRAVMMVDTRWEVFLRSRLLQQRVEPIGP